MWKLGLSGPQRLTDLLEEAYVETGGIFLWLPQLGGLSFCTKNLVRSQGELANIELTPERAVRENSGIYFGGP